VCVPFLSNGLYGPVFRVPVSKISRPMKRSPLFALALFLVAAPHSFAQSVSTAPLDRTEILGRLALGYSPSYIAYLVKTRGLSFSISASFLDRVTQLGGSGILVDTLPHAASPNSIDPSSVEGPPVEHLGKCALLTHTGDLDSAELECRASIDENPKSLWPLRATLEVLQMAGFDKSAFEPTLEGEEETKSDDPRTKELNQLTQRLAALTPPPSAPVQGSVTVATFGSSVVMIGRTTGTPASGMLEVEESAGMWDARNELYGFIETANFSEEPGEPPVSIKSPEVPSQLLADVQDNPDVARFRLDLARFYSEQANDFEEALAEIREAIRLEPDSERPHVQLALLYHKQKDFVNSLAELREVTRIAPAGNFEHLALGHELENAGHTADAIGEYKTIIDRHPERIDASEALVDLYVEQKDFKSAVEELRRSLKASAASFGDESKFVDLRWSDESNLAYYLEQDHDLGGAAEQYQYLLRFKPDDEGLHNDYGNVLMDQHHCDQAIGEYNEAVRLDPTVATPHHNTALCLATKKDLAGAVNEFREALQLDPDSPHSRVFLAEVLGQTGDLNTAMDEFHEVLKKDPNDLDAHAGLGFLYLQMKNEAQAVVELKKVLELKPDVPMAENNLAWIYATSEDQKLRNPSEALRLARQAIKTSPQPNSAFIDTLAEALLLNGKADEALVTETQAAHLDPDNPELKSRLARFREAANNSPHSEP
jgi:tetratricopeptide (TPR) repeat protein